MGVPDAISRRILVRRVLLGLVFLMLVGATYAHADTVVQLQLCNVSPGDQACDGSTAGGNHDATDYVYPYNFSINGSSPLVSLLCDDYKDEVFMGETWYATVNKLT